MKAFMVKPDRQDKDLERGSRARIAPAYFDNGQTPGAALFIADNLVAVFREDHAVRLADEIVDAIEEATTDLALHPAFGAALTPEVYRHVTECDRCKGVYTHAK